jgi:hypothetical protein
VAVAAATVVTGAMSANASRRAGDAAARGADAATAESARQYDQTRSDFAPWRAAGSGAVNQLNSLFGLGGAGASQWNGRDLFGSQGGIPTVDAERYAADPAYRYAWDTTLASERASRPGWDGQSTYNMPGTDADFARLNDSLARNISEYNTQHPEASAGSANTPNMSGFFTSPGYNFRRGEGMRGIENTFAARGGAQSGNALRALTEFNSNLASGEFGNYFNQLASIAGLGQTATGQTAAAGANYANQAGRNALYAGDARASGINGQANAWGNTLQGLAGLYGYYNAGRTNAFPMGGDMGDYGGSGINPYTGRRG